MSASISHHTQCIACDHLQLNDLSSFQHVHLVKCAKCGLVFCADIPSISELEKYYSNYGLQQYLSPITVKRYHEWLDKFEVFRKTGNLMDVGCGNGLFLMEAKKRGWKVYGTEYGGQQVEICREKGIVMHQGPLLQHLFPDIIFDVVTSIEVIEHINNPQVE